MNRRTIAFHSTLGPEFRRSQSVHVHRSAWPTSQTLVRSYVPMRSFLQTSAPIPHNGY